VSSRILHATAAADMDHASVIVTCLGMTDSELGVLTLSGREGGAWDRSQLEDTYHINRGLEFLVMVFPQRGLRL
jgi:hypothetical protein